MQVAWTVWGSEQSEPRRAGSKAAILGGCDL